MHFIQPFFFYWKIINLIYFTVKILPETHDTVFYLKWAGLLIAVFPPNIYSRWRILCFAFNG